MIFLLLFLLLTVPSAWADEWSNGKVIEGATSCANYMTAPGGGCLKLGRRWLYTDPVLGPQIITKDEACLAKMESAMRAAEKYSGFIPDVHDPTAQTAVKEYREMLLLWESTKRDCWRKP